MPISPFSYNHLSGKYQDRGLRKKNKEPKGSIPNYEILGA